MSSGITKIGPKNNFIIKVIEVWLNGPTGCFEFEIQWSPKGFCDHTHIVLNSKMAQFKHRELIDQKWEQLFFVVVVLTVAARQGVAPLVIFLTNNWLLITQRVPWVTCERHSGASGEAAATAAAVDWDTGIQARIRLHFHTCESERESRLTNGSHSHIIDGIKPVFCEHATGLTFISNTKACCRTAVVGGKQQEEHVGSGYEEMRSLGTVVFTNQGRRSRGTIPNF